MEQPCLKVKMCPTCPYQRHRGAVCDAIGVNAETFLCITCPNDPHRPMKIVSTRGALSADLRSNQTRLRQFTEEAHEYARSP